MAASCLSFQFEVSAGADDETRARCDNDQPRQTMHAVGERFASCRAKDRRHIAMNAMRLATSMNSPSKRGDPLAMSRMTNRPDAISRVPFTDSHAEHPVEGGGEPAMPKSADAEAGANQKRDPRKIIASAIRPERTFPIKIIENSFQLQIF